MLGECISVWVVSQLHQGTLRGIIHHASALDFSFCKMFKVWTRCLLKNPHAYIPELRFNSLLLVEKRTHGRGHTALDPGSEECLLELGLSRAKKGPKHSLTAQLAACALEAADGALPLLP